MSNYDYIDNGAYIETDIAYDTVYWYIGDPDTPDDLQYVGETLGVGGATRAWFYPDASDCPGHIKGEKYRIAARAWYYNPFTKTSTSDYETRDFIVYDPVFDSRSYDDGTYAYGELRRQYFDGSQIAVDYYGYAHKFTKTGWTQVYTIMVHELTGHGHREVQHPKDEDGITTPQRIGPNHGSYSNTHTIGFPVRTKPDGRLAQLYQSDAYIRVVVNGDMSWKVPSTSTFIRGELPYGELPD